MAILIDNNGGPSAISLEDEPINPDSFISLDNIMFSIQTHYFGNCEGPTATQTLSMKPSYVAIADSAESNQQSPRSP